MEDQNIFKIKYISKSQHPILSRAHAQRERETQIIRTPNLQVFHYFTRPSIDEYTSLKQNDRSKANYKITAGRLHRTNLLQKTRVKRLVAYIRQNV